MNATSRFLLAAVVATIAHGVASAQEEVVPAVTIPLTPFAARADVQAQAITAQYAGQIARGEASTPNVTFRSSRSRADVMSEVHHARSLGHVGSGESPGIGN